MFNTKMAKQISTLEKQRDISESFAILGMITIEGIR